ncbi:MAG: Chromate resistance protein ChrB [Nocardioidaceae bacterium]
MFTIEQHRWLLITASTAGAPASLRVTVWRRLKALGALYLQQSVCLLPACTQTREAVQSLGERVRRDGGSLRTLTLAVTDPDEHAELVGELQDARDGEYAEVLDRLPAFFAELATETTRGRTTFEELEESEVDLARFNSWMAKIAARDYFQAPIGHQARNELALAEQALASFAALAEATATETDQTAPRLRSIQ